MGGGRAECRNADSSCNPYLAAALLLAAGLEGVREKLDPGAPHEENLYELNEAQLREAGVSELPRTLGEAVDAFAADPFIEQTLGAPAARRVHPLQARRVGAVPPGGEPVGDRPLRPAVLVGPARTAGTHSLRLLLPTVAGWTACRLLQPGQTQDSKALAPATITPSRNNRKGRDRTRDSQDPAATGVQSGWAGDGVPAESAERHRHPGQSCHRGRRSPVSRFHVRPTNWSTKTHRGSSSTSASLSNYRAVSCPSSRRTPGPMLFPQAMPAPQLARTRFD